MFTTKVIYLVFVITVKNIAMISVKIYTNTSILHTLYPTLKGVWGSIGEVSCQPCHYLTLCVSADLNRE
jgi:hypothetical protein